MAIDQGRITVTPATQVAGDENLTVVTPVENNTIVVNIGQVTRTPGRLMDLTDINMGTKEDGSILEYDGPNDRFNLKRDPRRLTLDGGNF